jgi:hypothetical protein
MPAVAAGGAAYLVWLVMQARIRVLAANYQAALARSPNGGEPPGLEELLSYLRYERRRFLRRMATAKGPENTIISQERIYFRNIPLTAWMEEEIPLGAGEPLEEACLLPVPVSLREQEPVLRRAS